MKTIKTMYGNEIKISQVTNTAVEIVITDGDNRGSGPHSICTYVSYSQVRCLADALLVAGYVSLLESGGLILRHQEDVSSEILKLLDDLEAKLGAWLAWQRFANPNAADADVVREAPGLIGTLRGLVQAGKLGYWLLVAQKPA